MLPAGFLAGRRALQFAPDRAPDRSLDPAWFAAFEECVVAGSASLAEVCRAAPDHSVGYIALSHMLEFEPDDRAAFAELCRIGSADAVLNVTFTSSMQSAETSRFDPPKPPYGRHWEYGRDIVERFSLAARGLREMMVTLTDPVTETSEPTHFFCRRSQDAEALAGEFGSRVVLQF